MSQYCDYYMVKGDEVSELLARNEGVTEKRQAIISAAMDKVGARGYTMRSSFSGESRLISWFAWPELHKFPCEVTIKDRSVIDNTRVVVARGKGNRKEGKAFNSEVKAVIDEANAQLKALPEFQDVIVEHYVVAQCGLGEPTGRGMVLLSTRAGTHPTDKTILLFAIPNRDVRNPVKIPDQFVKITYGQFYDMAHSE